MIKTLLILLFVYTNILSNQIYFLPTDKEKALDKIISSISNAKQSINIAMYSFKNKKIAKAIIKASNKNIPINIILDSKALTQKSKIRYLSRNKKINIYTLKGIKRKNKKYAKMHSKYMTIDNKIAFFGSANYSNSSFNGNHEVIFLNDDKKTVNQFNKNFKEMLKISTKYTNKKYAINGDIIEIQTNSPYIKFNKKTYHPITKNNFIIPINYKIRQDTYTITHKDKTTKVKIQKGNYKREVLRVKKSKTSLTKKQQQRAIKEALQIRKLYKNNIPKQWNSEFIYPLQSKRTSLYGNSRIFNNKILSYHSGLDFRAKTGTKILSANDGIVAFSGDLFYAGKSVIINHGKEIFTLYAHLSETTVRKNQQVKKGSIVGISGKSGRVTGAHLHFGTILNGIKVNPTSFIKAINKI